LIHLREKTGPKMKGGAPRFLGGRAERVLGGASEAQKRPEKIKGKKKE
jgi:hypothetical protein